MGELLSKCKLIKVKKLLLFAPIMVGLFIIFRFSLIKELKKENIKVIVITQFDGYEKKIAKEVDEIYPLNISRGALIHLSI